MPCQSPRRCRRRRATRRRRCCQSGHKANRVVIARVRTDTGHITSIRRDAPYWIGPVWHGVARLDGRPGHEIVVGQTMGLHAHLYRALTWRRGHLVTLDAPGPDRYWYTDGALRRGGGMAGSRRGATGVLRQRSAHRVSKGSKPFRGRVSRLPVIAGRLASTRASRRHSVTGTPVFRAASRSLVSRANHPKASTPTDQCITLSSLPERLSRRRCNGRSRVTGCPSQTHWSFGGSALSTRRAVRGLQVSLRNRYGAGLLAVAVLGLGLPLLGASVAQAADTIAFRASAQSAANQITHRVTIPAAVRESDGLLLFVTSNQALGSVTETPAGWTRVGSEVAQHRHGDHPLQQGRDRRGRRTEPGCQLHRDHQGNPDRARLRRHGGQPGRSLRIGSRDGQPRRLTRLQAPTCRPQTRGSSPTGRTSPLPPPAGPCPPVRPSAASPSASARDASPPWPPTRMAPCRDGRLPWPHCHRELLDPQGDDVDCRARSPTPSRIRMSPPLRRSPPTAPS